MSTLIACADGGEAWELRVRSDGMQVQQPSEMRLGRTAVGLAIARKAVEEHGGKLTWESSPEGGSAARFSLLRPAQCRSRLEQIFSRLVEHALEHRVGGGQGRALIECADSGEAWELTVRSEGMQVQEPSETRLGRAAIGLAIARKAVEEHGGKLTWESSPEGGSVARFSLPKP